MIAALITTRNEAESIASLVEECYEHVDRVYVVDENSTDQTLDRAFRAGAYIDRAWGGIGPCVMHGWRRALGTPGFTRLVQLDAGRSHDPAAIPELLASPAMLTIGSRFVAGGLHLGSGWRRHGSRLYGRLLTARTGVGIADWTSSYRVFSRAALEILVRRPYRCCSMYGFHAEVLRHAIRAHLSIAEMPIVYEPSRSALSWKGIREAAKVLK